MASALMFATRSTQGEQPNMRRLAEKAGQSFVAGVPVQMDTATGGIQEWDGTTVTTGIAGVAKEAASNLTTTGVALPQNAKGTVADVPNQPNARSVYRGAPFNDGRVAVEVGIEDSVFYGQVGPAQTTAATDVGKQYGMTKDTDGHWFVDKTKTTVGTNTVVTVVKLDPYDTARGVHFVISRAVQQLIV